MTFVSTVYLRCILSVLCLGILSRVEPRLGGFLYDGMLCSFRRHNLVLVTSVPPLVSSVLPLAVTTISTRFLTIFHSSSRSAFSCALYLPMLAPEMEPAFHKSPVSWSFSIKRRSTMEDKPVESLAPIDEASEKKLLRKCDLHVVPIISILYVLSFLDRINIANARIQGLESDLDMSGQDYNIALMVFFIPYILFEVPSNILIRKIRPSVWLSLLMMAWGMATTPE